MEINVLINGVFKTKINSITNSDNEEHIKNIVLRTLPRRNIILVEELKNIKKPKLCYNCESLAQYELEYSIEKLNNSITFNIIGFKYPVFGVYEKLYCGTCLKHLKLNGNSIEFVSKVFNVNTEIANDIILKRNKSPFYKNNHQSLENYIAWQRRDEEWYINKYGEELGKIKHKQNVKKWYEASSKFNYKKDSMSLKHFIAKNNGDIEKAKAQKKKRNEGVSNSLSKYIERYGKEEGTKKYFKKCSRLAYANSIEYYKEKYGEEIGIIKHNEWRKKCSISLNTFTNKYDEKDGHIRYKKWLCAVSKPLNKKFFSKESYNFFKKLQEYIGNDIKILHGDKEFFIYDKKGFNNQHIFFYDAYIKKFNLIIEYDTPISHPNPHYLTEEEINKSNYYNGSYEKDLFKEKLAESHNYKFYRVFVKNKKDRKNELEKLIKYIKNYEN
jgi:hypothetical protein